MAVSDFFGSHALVLITDNVNGKNREWPAIQVKEHTKGYSNEVYCHLSEVNEALKCWIVFPLAKIRKVGCALSCSHLFDMNNTSLFHSYLLNTYLSLALFKGIN